MTHFILVDFDGTLTRVDGTRKFVSSLIKPRHFITIVGILYLIAMYFVRGKHLKQIFKNRAISSLLAQLNENQIEDVIQKYIKWYTQNSRKDLISRFKQLQTQGYTILIVSASPAFLLKRCFGSCGFYIIATEFESVSGVFSGKRLTKNCYGQEKVERIREFIAEKGLSSCDVNILEAWTDDISDLPMMELAANKYWISNDDEDAIVLFDTNDLNVQKETNLSVLLRTLKEV